MNNFSKYSSAITLPDSREYIGYKHLPIELFTTENNNYIFDCRSVSFFKVDPLDFKILSLLRERNLETEELIALFPDSSEEVVRNTLADLLNLQSEGLLTPYTFSRLPRHENPDFEETLSESMGGLTIFITTDCNLGCSYCIYGGQYEQHGKLSRETMPWKTLRNTMDFLRDHSGKSDEVRLDFFGGEPLLVFPILRRAVNYFKSIIDPGGPKVLVTITSNGTIMNDEIMEFLLEHDVYLQFSIDGSQKSHDENRVFKSGPRGSHGLVMKNLQHIHDRDPAYYRKNMRLKGVLSTRTMDDEREFFEQPLIRLIAEKGHYTFLDEEPHYDLARDGEYFERLHALGRMLLEMRGVTSDADIRARLPIKKAALYRHTFGRFFGAQIVAATMYGGQDSLPFTKGCLMGYQQGAVMPGGDIAICLKSAKGGNFIIGNVNKKKWFFKRIQRLNNELHGHWPACNSCFLQKICDLCYEKLNGETGMFSSGRRKFCEFNREKHRVLFTYMLTVCENNPELWRFTEHAAKEERENNDVPCPARR